MMIIRTKEDFKDMSVEELVIEEQKLIKRILKFEDEYILKKTSNDSLNSYVIENPSPTVIWRCDSEELVIITQLIDEKTRDEHGIGIEF